MRDFCTVRAERRTEGQGTANMHEKAGLISLQEDLGKGMAVWRRGRLLYIRINI